MMSAVRKYYNLKQFQLLCLKYFLNVLPNPPFHQEVKKYKRFVNLKRKKFFLQFPKLKLKGRDGGE